MVGRPEGWRRVKHRLQQIPWRQSIHFEREGWGLGGEERTASREFHGDEEVAVFDEAVLVRHDVRVPTR